MSNLDIVWSRSNASALAAHLVADSIKKAETREAASKRVAEKQREKRQPVQSGVPHPAPHSTLDQVVRNQKMSQNPNPNAYHGAVNPTPQGAATPIQLQNDDNPATGSNCNINSAADNAPSSKTVARAASSSPAVQVVTAGVRFNSPA